ncbi:MAG: sigma-70 family RNA polymerase sigma factor [Chlorobi bacterium]|nr:sigma-70 family RNA polymerase sigma factor [Chlorobiota bacterium]
MSKYSELSDLDLLREVSKYHSLALEELYNRYSSLLFTLVKKIAPDTKSAEYILVEVFTIIWRKIDKFDFTNGNPYVWLISLARNRAVDSVRRSRPTNQALDFYDDEYEDYFILPFLPRDIAPMDLHTAMRVRHKIEAGLDHLSDAQKFVIHLAYYEGYSLDEIKDKLSLPIETVRNKVMTALYGLKDFLLVAESALNAEDDPDVYEMISAFALGCLDVANFIRFKKYVKGGGYLPRKELGELQNVVSLIPTVLELDIPDPKLKDNVAKKLLGFKDEIKEKILKQKEETSISEDVKSKPKAVQKETAPPEKITEPAQPAVEKTEEKGNEPKKEKAKPEAKPKPKPEKEKEKREIQKEKLPLDYDAQTELMMEKRSAPWALILLFVLLVAAGISTVYFYQQTGDLKTKVLRLTNSLNNLRSDLRKQSEFITANKAIIDFLKKKDVEIVNLVGSGNSSEATGKLFLSFSEGKGLLKVDNLPDLDSNKVYHCWFVGKNESFDILKLGRENFNGIHAIPKLPYVDKKEINLIRVTDEKISNNQRPEGNTFLYGALPR